MDVLNLIKIIFTSIKGLLATNAGRKFVFEDTQKTLKEELTVEGMPTTFFSRVRKAQKDFVDFISSPTVGQIIAVSSACYMAITGGFVAITGVFMWSIAAAVIATAIVATGIGIGIQAVRLRNFQKSQLEIAILEELNNVLIRDPNKEKKLQAILEKPEFKNFKAKDDIDYTKKKEFSLLKSAGKQMGNSLCENAAATALSILTGDWLMVAINGATMIFTYGNNAKMRATQDREYLKQKNVLRAIKAELGVDIPTKDVAKLRNLYKEVTGNEFSHKVPTFGSALWESTITNGLSSRRTLLQYATPNNRYRSGKNNTDFTTKDTQVTEQQFQEAMYPMQQSMEKEIITVKTGGKSASIKQKVKESSLKMEKPNLTEGVSVVQQNQHEEYQQSKHDIIKQILKEGSNSNRDHVVRKISRINALGG